MVAPIFITQHTIWCSLAVLGEVLSRFVCHAQLCVVSTFATRNIAPVGVTSELFLNRFVWVAFGVLDDSSMLSMQLMPNTFRWTGLMASRIAASGPSTFSASAFSVVATFAVSIPLPTDVMRYPACVFSMPVIVNLILPRSGFFLSFFVASAYEIPKSSIVMTMTWGTLTCLRLLHCFRVLACSSSLLLVFFILFILDYFFFSSANLFGNSTLIWPWFSKVSPTGMAGYVFVFVSVTTDVRRRCCLGPSFEFCQRGFMSPGRFLNDFVDVLTFAFVYDFPDGGHLHLDFS